MDGERERSELILDQRTQDPGGVGSAVREKGRRHHPESRSRAVHSLGWPDIEPEFKFVLLSFDLFSPSLPTGGTHRFMTSSGSFRTLKRQAEKVNDAMIRENKESGERREYCGVTNGLATGGREVSNQRERTPECVSNTVEEEPSREVAYRR